MMTRLLLFFAAALLCFSAFAEETKNSVGMTLRLLEAGRFERGGDDIGPGFHKDHSDFNTAGDESPRHPVVLTRPFYLATTEVTVGQFRAFVDATGYKTTAEQSENGARGWDPTPPPKRERYVATFRDGKEFTWKNPGFEQTDQHPVTCVSYRDALAFCEWLSKKEGATSRLPTEAEWEYAARAGTTTYFSFGNIYRGVIHKHANLGNVELEKAFPDRVRRQWLVDIAKDPADPHVFTAPVAAYEANPWGLYDLHGNVWEWCADRYLDTAYTAFERGGYQQVRKRAIDPRNDTPWTKDGEERVIRGGSWFNGPVQCRAGVRGYFEADEGAAYLGFRVARDAAADAIAAAEKKHAAAEAAREKLFQLADRVQERRDGRLSIDIQQKRELLAEDAIGTFRLLNEPFDLHVNGQGKLTAEQLAAITDSPFLRGLTLNGIGAFVDDDFAFLAARPQLEILHLSEAPKLTDRLFAHLAGSERLESLHLYNPALTDEGWLQLPSLKRMRSLSLQGAKSQGRVLERVVGSPLETFSCGSLSDENAKLLAGFRTLRDVSLGGSPITGPSLAALAKLQQLTRIELSNCERLQDADFACLGEIYNLSSVALDRTAAGDLAVDGLVRLNGLHHLHLGSPQLSNAGLKNICGIVSLKSVIIRPEADRVTDDGLIDLWRLVNLETLTLSPPQITGSGLSAVAELGKLRDLNLTTLGLTDAACTHIAKSESLRQLHLGSWQGGPPALTDAALRSLATATELQQLNLFRKGTQVTDDGAAELRKNLPKVRIQIHGP